MARVSSTSARRRAAGLFGGLTALWIVLMLAPMPIFFLWELRLIARETALLPVATGLVAVACARGWAQALCAVGAVVAALPLVLPLPRFAAHGAPFSLAQYLGRAVPTAGVTVERDVPLDPAQPNLVADFYRGSQASPRPFVLVLHGGSWQHGDKGEVEPLSRRLAEAGITVVDLRYRLSPAHPFPAAVADAKCALGRLRQDAARFNLDGARAAVLGRSAGGQLALLTGYSAGNTTLAPSCTVPDEPVRAVVALYPFTDLLAAYASPPVPDPEETRAVLQAHFGGAPDGARAAAYRAADPLGYFNAHSPPTLLVHGTSDVIVPIEHSRRMARLPGVQLVEVPFADHAFDHRQGGAGDQLATHAIVQFAVDQLQP